MTGASQPLLWAWVALTLTSRAVALPEAADAKFVDECVRLHNKARASVSPPAADMLYMTWDEGLANIARAWASGCDYGHNEKRIHPVFPSVGENIWAGSPPSYFSVRRAVESWANETEDYDYEGNRCSEGKQCGHYTQIVWASTYKVGCAAEQCSNGINRFSRPGVFFVCNYAPHGNIGPRLPYDARGPACSRCTGDCQDNLCRSPERDGQTPYDRSPDSEASGSGRAGYVSILLTRPLALFFTVVTAYAVRYKYPDVFCYE